MAGFKVGFIMFRIIHCSSAFPDSMKKSDWVAGPKKGQYGKRGGWEVDNRVGWKEGRSGRTGRSIVMEKWQGERENKDFRKT